MARIRRFRVTSVTYGKPARAGARRRRHRWRPAAVRDGSDRIGRPAAERSGHRLATRVELWTCLFCRSRRWRSDLVLHGRLLARRRTVPGVSLFRPTADGLDYTVSGVADVASVIGDTVTTLAPGPAHVWDNGNTVEVQLAFDRSKAFPMLASSMVRTAR